MFVRRMTTGRHPRAVLGIVALVVTSVALASCGVAQVHSTSTRSTTSLSTLTMPPASTPPVLGLCSHVLTKSADGNVMPLRCSNGALNRLAWHFYRNLSSTVMSLGRHVTWARVERAMCEDRSRFHATLPEEQNAAFLSSYYYGWKLNVPIAQFTGAPCSG